MRGDKSHLGRLMSLFVVFVFIVALVVSFTTVQAGKLEGHWKLMSYYPSDLRDHPMYDSAGFTKILGNEKVCHKYESDVQLRVDWGFNSATQFKEMFPGDKVRAVKIEMIDPSGVVYSASPVRKIGPSTVSATYWIDVPCPDYSRPGYWKFVVVDVETSSVLDEMPFYVQPKEHKGFSVQAICGPASIVGLALIPLGLLGMRRRKNN